MTLSMRFVRLEKGRDRSYADIRSQGFEAVLMRSIRVTSAKKSPAEDGVEASVSFELTVPSGLVRVLSTITL